MHHWLRTQYGHARNAQDDKQVGFPSDKRLPSMTTSTPLNIQLPKLLPQTPAITATTTKLATPLQASHAHAQADASSFKNTTDMFDAGQLGPWSSCRLSSVVLTQPQPHFHI
jgi:hypothetical protein